MVCKRWQSKEINYEANSIFRHVDIVWPYQAHRLARNTPAMRPASGPQYRPSIHVVEDVESTVVLAYGLAESAPAVTVVIFRTPLSARHLGSYLQALGVTPAVPGHAAPHALLHLMIDNTELMNLHK